MIKSRLGVQHPPIYTDDFYRFLLTILLTLLLSFYWFFWIIPKILLVNLSVPKPAFSLLLVLSHQLIHFSFKFHFIITVVYIDLYLYSYMYLFLFILHIDVNTIYCNIFIIYYYFFLIYWSSCGGNRVFVNFWYTVKNWYLGMLGPDVLKKILINGTTLIGSIYNSVEFLDYICLWVWLLSKIFLHISL